MQANPVDRNKFALRRIPAFGPSRERVVGRLQPISVALLNRGEHAAAGGARQMPFSLGRIGQIALAVRDVDRAEAFYQDTLGPRKLYRYADLSFFDCAGVRLVLEKARDPEDAGHASPLYFTCPDIALAVGELQQRGVAFSSPPQLIANMADHDLWMAFFDGS
jgi:methylmalonyl-CoA/ethylmalonyl-CoA epimerase